MPSLRGRGTPRGPGKLVPQRRLFREPIAQDLVITRSELRGALAEADGVQVHPSSIAGPLSRRGIKYSKRRRGPPNAVARR